MICKKCGKEIIKTETNEQTNHAERIVQKVSFKDSCLLAVRTLLSTPSKFILLLVITLFFTLFLFFGNMTFLYMEDVAEDLVETTTSADKSTFNSRIIVRRTDNEPFTMDEIEKLGTIANVSAVVRNDIFFNSTLYVAFEEDVDYNYYQFPIQLSENLKSSDLMWGRLPKNENEVVLAMDYKYLNKTVYVVAEGALEPRICKVVGLLPTNSDKSIYIHSSIIDEIVERVEMNSIKISHRQIPADNTLASLAKPYDWYMDESLADNQIRVETHTTRSSSSEAPLVEYTWSDQNMYFSSNDHRIYLDYSELIYHKHTYPAVEETGLSGKEFVLHKCAAGTNPNIAFLSKTNYEKLLEFNTQYFQISLIAKNEASVEGIVAEIEKGDYFCSSKALVENEAQVLEATMLKTIVVVAIIVITIGLSFIVYIILRNILNSQQKSFLIMRSLGIDGSRITIQIYIELAFTLLINFIIIFILWLLFKFRNFGGFFSSVHHSGFTSILLIYVVTTVVFALLGFKYSTSVNNSAIVNKEME